MAASEQYHAGQTVRATLDFVDGGKVREVTATFVHEDDPLEKFRLTGVPEERTASGGDGYTYWEVVLSGSVTAENKLGEYRCEVVEASYPGGRQVEFSGIPDTGFSVVEERILPPQEIEWRWEEPSEEDGE